MQLTHYVTLRQRLKTLASGLMTVMLVASLGVLICVLHAGENAQDSLGAKTAGPSPKSK